MEESEGRGAESRATGAAPERDAAPAVPQPVRVGMVTASAPAAPPVPPRDSELRLDVDGVSWTARLLGCAGTAKAPLLLVGFFHPDDPSAARKQAFVVGRALRDLTELQLEAAWRTSVPYVGPLTRRPFFLEITSRGGREG